MIVINKSSDGKCPISFLSQPKQQGGILIKKLAMFALIGLVIISFIMNIDLLLTKNHSQTSPKEVEGAFEMFLVDLKGIQFALDEYNKSSDQNTKTISMFRLIRDSNEAYHDIQELDRKSFEVYGETLSLQKIIFDFSENAFHRAIDSLDKDITSQLQTMKEQIDSLINSLNSTNITDKESLEKIKTKLSEL